MKLKAFTGMANLQNNESQVLFQDPELTVVVMQKQRLIYIDSQMLIRALTIEPPKLVSKRVP